MPEPARVLVADVAEMDEKIRECLPGHDLTFVRTMWDAMRALRQDGFQLVVIGLEFDESRMLELLQYVRGLPRYLVRHQARVPEHLQVQGDGLLGDVEVLGDLVDRPGLVAHQPQDRPPARVRKGVEGRLAHTASLANDKG